MRIFLPLLLALLPGTANAAENWALQSSLDHAWMMTAAGLVFFMQAGFMLLEAGTVRAKNSVNVAQKNLVDFLISTVAFGAIGFTLMFGESVNGLIGWDSDLALFGETDKWSATFFVFQLVFCGTAATIMSGAVAERMKLGAYMYLSLCIGVLIYPVVGHWTWGGLLNGSDGPWLADMGFMDFAGGTVVHSVGAWVGLAAIVLLGPRLGKYDENGEPIKIHGHSPILATVGAVIIWVGWIGFNGGSTSVASDNFATIVRNTMIAAGAAGIASMLLSRMLSGHYTPAGCINGTLAGLVAVTPGCDVLAGPSSFVLGILAGFVVVGSERFFEYRLRLDDPLGAVSVHGVCGAFGTVMLAVLAPEESLILGDRFAQILVQIIGVLAVFAFCMTVTVAVLLPLKARPDEDGGNGIRVPLEHEKIGLNVAEHDAPLGTGVLQAALERMAMDDGGSFTPLDIERGDEAYEMAQSVNTIMDQMQKAILAMDTAVDATARGEFSSRINLEGLEGTPKRLCEGLNSINSVCEQTFDALSEHFADLSAGQLFLGESGMPRKGRFASLMSALTEALSGLHGLVIETLGEAASTVNDSEELMNISDFLLEGLHTQTDIAVKSKDQLEAFATAMTEQAELSASTAEKCAAAQDLAGLGALRISQSSEGMARVDSTGQDIRKAVEKIRTIATTTKLLAVNASIEAARAADTKTGRGFQNVAEEVQRLAIETHEVVADIVDRSQNIQDEIKVVGHLISETQDNLHEIADATETSAQMSEAAAKGIRLQNKLVTEISGAMSEVSRSAETSLSQMQDGQTIITRLANGAKNTATSLSHFKTNPTGALKNAA